MVDLYHFEPSTNGGKAIIALFEKGVAFTSHWIDLFSFQQLSPEYLRINPRGQVPTLVHDGAVITESTPMGEYIDEAFEGPPLRPRAPLERWRARVLSRYADEYVSPSVSMVACHQFVTPMMRRFEPARLEAVLAAIPDQERRRTWETTIRNSFTQDQLSESRRRMAAAAPRLEGALEGRNWFAGSSFSLADINIFSMAGGLPLFLPELVNETTTPRLMDWFGRVRDRPAVKAAQALSRNVFGAPPEEPVGAPPGG